MFHKKRIIVRQRKKLYESYFGIKKMNQLKTVFDKKKHRNNGNKLARV